MPPFLRIEHVTRSYGDEAVLRDVSLTLEAHHTLSVLGRSGCGKTTLLKGVAGLVPLDRGEIFLGDRRLGGLPPQERNVIYLYQEPLLFPHLDVFENIVFGLRLRKLDEREIRHRAEEMIASLDLAAHARKRPEQLSGGQRQRAAFGRALIVRPALLLLDEPFSNLDPDIRGGMQRLFMKVARRMAITSIFVTHDLKESLVVGDRFALLENGHLHLYGSREEFIADARTGVDREIDFWNSIRKEAADAGV
ncbi:MAG: ABC transporter ATP-binding protein [Verrucomicrobiota bacterium]